MTKILIIGPNDLFRFSNQVSNLVRYRMKNEKGEEIKIKDIFGEDYEGQFDYLYESNNTLSFKDAIIIFNKIIDYICSQNELDETKKLKLQNLKNEIENDDDVNAINEFNNIVSEFRNFPIEIANSEYRDPDGIDKIYTNIKTPEILQETLFEIDEMSKEGLYLAVNAHGQQDQTFWILQKGQTHPSELVQNMETTPTRPIILDVFSCYAGIGINSGIDEFGKYSENLKNNTAAILNGGDKTVLMSFEKYLLNDLQRECQENQDLNDPFSIFLYKIFQSPNTNKIVHKDENGKVHIFEHSFIEPDSSEDVSQEKIREYVISEIDRFISWCQENELCDVSKLKKLKETYENRLLDSKNLQKLGNAALFLETYCGNHKTAKFYLEKGYEMSDECLGMPIKHSDINKTLNSLSLISNLLRWGDANKDNNQAQIEDCQDAINDNIKNGIYFDFVDKNGDPLLLLACKYQNVELVEALLNLGADPMKNNRKSSETSGVNVISVALFKANTKIIKLLVQNDKFTLEKNHGEDSEQALRRMISNSNKSKDSRRQNSNNIPPISPEQIDEIVAAFKASHPMDVANPKTNTLSTNENRHEL